MPTRLEQMKEAARLGRLTPSDLSVWFERPRPTIVSWVYDGREPYTFIAELDQRLYKLNQAIAAGHFPVPFDVRAFQRPAYIKKVRDHVLKSGLSEAHPSN